MVFISHRSPECHGVRIGNQNLNRQSLVPWPNLCAENFHRPAANPLPAFVANHKKMPQVYFLRFFAEQGIGDNPAIGLEQYSSILPSEPAPHPLVKFWNGHRVPMSLVPYQLVIQLGESVAIGQRGEAKGKGRPNCFHARVSIIPESAKQPK